MWLGNALGKDQRADHGMSMRGGAEDHAEDADGGAAPQELASALMRKGMPELMTPRPSSGHR